MNIPIRSDEVLELMQTPRPPLILDSRPGAAYLEGHLPTAYNADSSDLRPESTTFESLVVFHSDVDAHHRVLGRFEKVEFIIYGETVDTRTCRALWLMHYSGQLSARLLLGGIRGWRADGHDTTAVMPEIDPVPFPVRSRRETIARIDELRSAVGDGRTVIVDTRSDAEFTGERIPEGTSRGGCIPGAVHFDATALLDGDTGSFCDLESVRASLENSEITPDRVVIPYSNDAGRSSILYVALRILGYRRVKNLLGGWREWVRPQAP